MLQLPEAVRSAPWAAVQAAAVWGGAVSVCPGFPVLGVFLALLQAKRGSSFRFSQGCERRQVGSRAGEVAAPPVLGGRSSLHPQPRAPSPGRSRGLLHSARFHEQSVARVAPEVLLSADGAVVLTWGKKRKEGDTKRARSGSRHGSRDAIQLRCR